VRELRLANHPSRSTQARKSSSKKS
jgi:hypothetical protein